MPQLRRQKYLGQEGGGEKTLQMFMLQLNKAFLGERKFRMMQNS